uniref:Uncharacterized protein n=1 Tax=Anopheles maculatus TaxID=74869 RepID=A0A182S9L8_9DIPT
MFVTATADCESPDGDPCVDAVRDLAYCPVDNPAPVPMAPSPRKPPTPAKHRSNSMSGGNAGLPPINRVPKAAPRATQQPPTPKPRSGDATKIKHDFKERNGNLVH